MVKSDSARKDFQYVVKGSNFMTPDIIDYFYSGDYAIELSKGTGILSDVLYGVTVVNADTMKHEHELSRVFESYEDAEQYINKLGR